MTDQAPTGGTYWRVRPDGAKWRCRDCGKQYDAHEVILFQHTVTGARSIHCLVTCVDAEWLATATCLGTV